MACLHFLEMRELLQMNSQLLHATATPPGDEDECDDGLLTAPQKEVVSQKINLDLGIGRCGCAKEENKKIIEPEKGSLLSAEQFLEFHNQNLVYNAIKSGVAVPFHLFLPIWRSVFSTLGPAIYEEYPSFVGFTPQNSDHNSNSMTDTEPGRCRRTDGRKWRCSKNVVPYKKYCERHMHRGRRQSSRKHVGTAQNYSKLDNRTSGDTRMPEISTSNSNMDNRMISTSMQRGLDPKQPCSDHRDGVPLTYGCESDKYRECNEASRTTTNARTPGNEIHKDVNSVCNGVADDHKEGNEFSFGNANTQRICGRKNNVAENQYLGIVSNRFGLSPRSVLHCGPGKQTSQDAGSKKIVEAEPQRCRRTDGKKWQCRQDAVPHEKYCGVHMHRGAKKLVLNWELASEIPNASARTERAPDKGINLNTEPENSHPVTSNDSTSDTSDATTITDENISFSHRN